MQLRQKSKRGVLAGACLFTALMLGGCGAAFPNLSDQQLDQAGEYAANLLLKYDSNNRRRLLSEEEMAKEEQRRAAWAVKPVDEEALPETEQTGNPAIGDTETGEEKPTVYGKLEDFYEFPQEIGIEYTGYEVGKSYPADQSSFFSLDAAAGKEILALKFRLTNRGEGAQKIDLMNRQGSYRVTVNGSYSRAQLTTLLDNDLATYQGTLLPGAAQELVLLIEIEQGTEISSLSIRLKNDAIESTIRLE